MGRVRGIRRPVYYRNIYKAKFLLISMDKNFEPLRKLLEKTGILLTELHEANLNVSEKNGFYIYNYNQNVLVPRDDIIIKMCRGFVLDSNGSVFNHGFDRFFNLHEAECDKVDFETTEIQEKLDGSAIFIWHTGKEWEVTTRSVFYPHEDSQNFKETFCRLFDEFNNLSKDYTYVFELLSKDNRIVTKYDKERVVLIGARNRKTGKEVSQNNLDRIATDIYVDRPKRYQANNIDECRKLFEEMNDDEEGLVIVDKNFNRLKLKQESYLKMAKIISLKDQDVLDYLLGKTEIDADFTDMPELKEKLERVATIHEEVLSYARMIYKNIKHFETDKEFASHALNYKIRGILFKFRKSGSSGNLDMRWKSLVEMHESIVKPERKKLIIMRGIPGCGKSVWIRENELDIYTICPDTLRLMYAAPNPGIIQTNDADVWLDVFRFLESRMKNGDFTIIDGTHTQNKSLKRYNKLCEQYGYKLEIKRFDTTLEEALERDNKREEYKKVPHDVIERMYNQINVSEGLNTITS